MKTSTLRNAISIALFTVVTGTAGLAVAQEATTDTTRPGPSPLTSRLIDRDFDLPAGNLAAALKAFSTQSGIRFDSQPGLLADKQTRAISGRMDWREALGQLLQGSGLEYRQTDGTTVVITTAGEGAASADGPSRAQLETATPQAAATDLEAVTVTGTRIRGGTSPSPVITIGSERIQEEGFTDLGEVIRSVPQNFTGGQNPGVLMGNVAGGGLANQNVTGGSGLNLRGLGPDASLTLLNGRRMSYGGIVQAVDISAIPVEAVERIEIVADGASAIYGSDAVGGVANVILKRDFDGLALSARYGIATDGGLTTREYTATAGAVWSNGGLIATYKDVSSDPIYARQRDYTDHLFEPSTIYAGHDLRSGLISAHQWLGDAVELRLDALRSEREQLYYYWLSVPTRYNILTPETTTSLVSPSIEFSLPNDWLLSFAGTWGKEEFIEEQLRVDVATEVVSLFLHSCYCNRSRTFEVNAEGPLFEMGGGDARLAVGAGYRKNTFAQSSIITDTVLMQGDQASRFAYAEINLPLIDADSENSRAERLEMTAAVRSEDYESFGRVTTPKLGLIYGPSADFTIKTSWGRSFKAPTLFQRAWSIGAALVLPVAYGGTGYADDQTVFRVGGGNPDLDPERARTWTASLVFHPQVLPGLEAEVTWFDIDYMDRVVQPILNYAQALSNPVYAEFVDYSPTPERQAELLAMSNSFSNNTGMAYDPSRVVAIVDGRLVNATRQRIKGLDLSGSYRFDLGDSQLTVRGAASWLDSVQQTRGTPTPYDLAGTLHNPAKNNSRIGVVWNHGGLSASTFVNYTSGVTNMTDGRDGASFTTVDATLRYLMDERAGRWSGLELLLSAANLLDRSPPLYVPIQPAYVAPYDSTSYSAIGRFLSLSVSKHW